MKKEIVSVIGLGFVGFPTACVLANSKNVSNKNFFEVNGIDKNISKINNIVGKKKFSNTSLGDKEFNKLIKNAITKNKIIFSNKIANVSKSDIVVISIGFDFNQSNFRKKFLELKKFFDELGKHIKPKSLILVETTLPPGTCDKIILPTLESRLKRRKLNIKDIFFCYSYERIMPGNNYIDSIINNYRCYSGMNTISKIKCKNFLKKFVNYKKYKFFEFENLIDCEASKILENSYRAINIAFIDEWTKFSFVSKINLNQIINAIKLRPTHNNIMRPGLGVGGYCLPKDPIFSGFSDKIFFKKNLKFPITDISLKINKNMFLSSLKFIKSKIKSFRNKKILILGAAYKNDVPDIRNSPSIDLAKRLKNFGSKIIVHDPVFKDVYKSLKIVNILPKFKDFDLIIFSVKHLHYLKIKKKEFAKKPIYFDINCVLNNSQITYMNKKKLKLEKLGGE